MKLKKNKHKDDITNYNLGKSVKKSIILFF
jgi:hypothetical protein